MSLVPSRAAAANLTGPQRRHLRVFLDHVEAAVCEVLRLAHLDPSHRTLTADATDLPAGFADRIRPEVTRIRGAIEALAVRFALETEQQSRLRRVQALLIAAAVEIEDTGSRALLAYGPVDPQLPQRLDPVLDEIGDALGAMIAALREEAGPPRPGRPEDA